MDQFSLSHKVYTGSLTYADISSDVSRIECNLGYCFKNKSLITQALVHRSYFHGGLGEDSAIKTNEQEGLPTNERFEFLGDAVLSLAISQYLVVHFKELSEGQLSKWRSALVNEKSLANLARQLNLGEVVLLSRHERRNGGGDKDSILADTLEAVIAAVFIDGGYIKARSVILKIFKDKLSVEQNTDEFHSDFKSALQELLQKEYRSAPHYRVLSEIGEDHNKLFTIGVFFEKHLLGQGTGTSKKRAAQAAALSALRFFREDQKRIKLMGLSQEGD